MTKVAKRTPFKVHPAAEHWPLLSDDELADMAESIKRNGLIHPIVLDSDGQLIDGRNRLRACELASIEPDFTTLPSGVDPVEYIIAANDDRRHASKGQRAMAVALGRIDSIQSVRSAAQSSGVNAARIGHAATVLVHAPELVPGILSGAVKLDAAYDTARQNKARQATAEEQAATVRADMERLQKAAPDLAELVIEERMSLSEARAAFQERNKQRDIDAKLMSERLSKSIKTALDSLATPEHRARAMDLFRDDLSYLDAPLDRATIATAAAHLTRLAEEWTA